MAEAQPTDFAPERLTERPFDAERLLRGMNANLDGANAKEQAQEIAFQALEAPNHQHSFKFFVFLT